MKGAERTEELVKPLIWSRIQEVGVETDSLTLIQGAASGLPPKFYLESLEQAINIFNQPVPQLQEQYAHDRGSKGLRKAIANYHKYSYPNLNPQQNIVVLNGAQVGMSASFTALTNPGDQIIVFQPFYSPYSKQAHINGAKHIGVPLFPKKQQSLQALKQKTSKRISFSADDEWTFDAATFQNSFSQKTKILVINSPHNPTGKIFQNADFDIIIQMLTKYPKVIVVEDNIYQSFVFDSFDYATIRKISQRQEFRQRSLSIYSAGKLMKATGIRLGWVLGCKSLIDLVTHVHYYMYSLVCPLRQKCIELCLKQIQTVGKGYIDGQNQRLQKNRDILLKILIGSGMDVDLWIPQSCYFMIMDISRVKIDGKYLEDQDGGKVPRDEAFVCQLAHQRKVLALPCSTFFGQSTKTRYNYVRFAFCKDQELLQTVGHRMNSF